MRILPCDIPVVRGIRRSRPLPEGMRDSTPCPIADSLFEKFAASLYLPDRMRVFGRQEDRGREVSKSDAARQALEQHWKKHGCRDVSKTGHAG
jgi:hypothetical protein